MVLLLATPALAAPSVTIEVKVSLGSDAILKERLFHELGAGKVEDVARFLAEEALEQLESSLPVFGWSTRPGCCTHQLEIALEGELKPVLRRASEADGHCVGVCFRMRLRDRDTQRILAETKPFPLWGYVDPSEDLLARTGSDGALRATALRTELQCRISDWVDVHALFSNVPIPAPGTELRADAGSFTGIYTPVPYADVRLFPPLIRPNAVFQVIVGGTTRPLKFATCWRPNLAGPVLEELRPDADIDCADGVARSLSPDLMTRRWDRIYLWKYKR